MRDSAESRSPKYDGQEYSQYIAGANIQQIVEDSIGKFPQSSVRITSLTGQIIFG